MNAYSEMTKDMLMAEYAKVNEKLEQCKQKADELNKQIAQENVLYLSEDSFDLPFSSIRAHSRNRVIHALGEKTFVAQCNFGAGGTWDGTAKNLQKNWSPVFCFADGSAAVAELVELGAAAVDQEQLADFAALQPATQSFL